MKALKAFFFALFEKYFLIHNVRYCLVCVDDALFILVQGFLLPSFLQPSLEQSPVDSRVWLLIA